MTWLISILLSHNVQLAQQQSLIKQNCLICDWVRAGSEDTRKLHEGVPQMSLVATPTTMQSADKYAQNFSLGMSYGHNTEKGH